MDRLFSRILSVILVTLFIASIALASGGPPGGGFYSGQTLQNVGSTMATVLVTAYDSASSATYTESYSVPVGDSVTFLAGDLSGVPDGFLGSAIVSSDQPIKAIVNVTNRLFGSNGVAGGTAAAQYGGVDGSQTGTTVSFPLAKSGFGPKTTAFYIQNAGSSSATFAASFLLGTSLTDPSPVTYNYTSPSLDPGQMAVIIPADAGAATSGLIGSLTVTSAEPMAGTVMEYETSTSPALILQGTTGFTPNDYDTRILFPVLKKQLFGRSTGLQVQNVTGSSVDVTMVYRGTGFSCNGSTYTEPVRTLAAGQSTTYLDSALLPTGCLGTAEATATGEIAGVVNEAFLPCTGTCVQRATTYRAFPAASATTKVVAPVFKEDFFGKWTGLSVQNVGASAASVTVVFQVGATPYTFGPITISPGGSKLYLDMTNATNYPVGNWATSVLPDGKISAVTITSDQPIIALANEAPVPGSVVVQDNINYEAFNVTP